jgi:hypothetical protein
VLALAVLAIAGAGAGCDLATVDLRAQATDEWKRTYTLPPDGRLEIVNVNGRIDVQTGEGPVEVVAERRVRAASEELARERLGQVQIEEDVSPTAVKLETKMPRGGGLFDGGGVDVTYRVRVPAGIQVRMKTVNGGIELAGLQAAVNAETTNGGVVARGLGGPVQASTTNGGIDVEVDRVAEDGIRLECTNGGIRLRLPRTAKASITARVANGGIDTGGLQIETTGDDRSRRRRLDGQLNGGGPRIDLQGTNGGITISGKEGPAGDF